ncbi:MAG: hypothetical protein DHS20C11_29390 [Lysobacteraceae bacterium]|nr:MAG: hypothetical protein DHS20C11_29390 [Xanthomonadaceae bacterium]
MSIARKQWSAALIALYLGLMPALLFAHDSEHIDRDSPVCDVCGLHGKTPPIQPSDTTHWEMAYDPSYAPAAATPCPTSACLWEVQARAPPIQFSDYDNHSLLTE